MAADTTAARFSTNIWSLTISQVIFRLATIVVFGYIGRELGVGVLGQYAIVMGVLNLYLSFSDLGVSNFVIKEVSQNHSLGELYLDNFFVLQIIVGILIIGLAILTGEVSGYSGIIMWGLAIGSIGLVFNGMANAYKALLSAQERLFPFAVIEALCMIVYVIGNLLVIVFQQGLLALVVVTVAVQITKYLIGIVWARKYNAKVTLRANPKIIRSMLWLGLPFLLFNSAHFGIQRLDVILIGALDSETASGIYAAASRLVYSSLFIIAVLGSALYPVFSRLLKEEPKRVAPLYYQVSNYVYILAAGVGLAFYALAPLVIHQIFGDKFPGSIVLLQILAWYVPVFALGLFPSNILMVGNSIWAAARVSVSGVGLMMIAVLSLYSMYSGVGVAIIVVLIEFLLAVAYLVLAHRHFKLGIMNTKVLNTSAVTVVAVAVHYLLPSGQEILRYTLPLVTFVLLIFSTRTLRFSDVTIITNILIKRSTAVS